jgi:hypothetical protein
MPMKSYHPDFTFSGNKVTPDEIDQDQQYCIINPSVDPVFVGTQTGTQTVTAALGIINTRLDYPRTLVGAIAAAAGSARGGSLVVNGFNQFGSAVSETIAIAPATGGGTTNGTRIFARVTSGTINFGTGDAGSGTARLGVGIGTTAALPIFGLPAKLGGTADIKSITWIDADTAKMHDAAAAANTAQHGVILNVTGGIAAADSFVVTYRSSFNNTRDENVFKS